MSTHALPYHHPLRLEQGSCGPWSRSERVSMEERPDHSNWLNFLPAPQTEHALAAGPA